MEDEKRGYFNKYRMKVSNFIGIQPTATSQLWYTYKYDKDVNNVNDDIANALCLNPSDAKLVEKSEPKTSGSSQIHYKMNKKISDVDTIEEFCSTKSDDTVDNCATVYYIK
jgi:hypothetical protein